MNHCAIDAALQLRAQPGFDWRQASGIQVFINSQGNQAVGQHLQADTVVQAQFSIRYNTACALMQGTVGLADFTAEALLRPEVRALAVRVTPIVDAGFERRFGRNVTPARIEASAGGKLFSAQVEQAKGGSEVPMTQDDLHRKLQDCLRFGGFDADRASAFEAAAQSLEHSADVAADLQRMIAAVTRNQKETSHAI